MTSNPIVVASPIQPDGRWAALASLVVAASVVTASMFSAWTTVTHVDYYRVNWTFGAGIAGLCWLATFLLVTWLAFAMIVAARRSYLPVAPPLVIWVACSIGTLAMLLVARQAAHLDELSDALEYHRFSRDISDGAIVVRVTNGVWLGLAGFVAATTAAWRLWQIARRQERESRLALAAVNAQIAAASGDLIDEAEPVELVPSL